MSIIRLPCEKCEIKNCKTVGNCPVIEAHNRHKISTTKGAIRLMKSLGMCHPNMEEN